ncbi:MAG: carboxypeptidase M32 [Bdellovibrionota bacterium]
MASQKENFSSLNKILCDIQDLKSISNVLIWDQSTHMPVNGAAMRGRQFSTLGKLTHEKFVGTEVKNLLNSLEGYENSFPYESYESSLLRFVRKEFAKATKLSPSFVNTMLEHQAASYDMWIKARAENNFKLIEPYLEKTLELSKTYAQHFEHEHIADPLIAESDEGFSAKQLKVIFQNLRQALVPLVDQVTKKEHVDDSCLTKHYPIDKQEKFNKYLVESLGYNFNSGRIDTTHHPFMITFSHGDVRITTRYKENNLAESLFSSIHEMGHAFYELGVDPSLDGTFLYGGTSSGVHESQSRLWENIVARSKHFWQHYYPILQKEFPQNLASVSLNEFYKSINKVSKSLIRTDADELTYNLHVTIRFDLELEMLEGNLKICDLPQAWNERYKKDLGVDVKSDDHGCLQDVHWFSSLIGGQFQGYTLGNIMSAQFYAAAVRANPTLESEIAVGEFGTLRTWLRNNLHQYGKKFTGLEVLKKATGQDLNIDPYISYLKRKFL